MSRSRLKLATCVLAALSLVGCQGPAADPPQPAAGSGTPSASAQPAAAFENPVWDDNFPDPMIFNGGGSYWAVATNGNGSNVQTLRSRDLTTWEQGDDAFPELPDWTTAGKVWAPEVAVHSKSSYVLYYTSIAPDPAIQCIGVAVGSKPDGPYRDRSAGPLVCEKDQGGSIDAHAFRASDGKRYLYWKNDGNAVGKNTYISVQQLDATGTKLRGKPRRLFKEDLGWEAHLVEAPFVWENAGKFHMFYSGNAFDSDEYAVGHAVADSPMGRFTKNKEPVLASNAVAAGPGHCALFERGGKVWMVYHAWPPDSVGLEIPGRTLWLSEVTFAAGGGVKVTPPTEDYPRKP
jgi:hypothetical protein